jgi:hypothetical protein
MQVFGLRRQVYQAARLASRLAARPRTAKRPGATRSDAGGVPAPPGSMP